MTLQLVSHPPVSMLFFFDFLIFRPGSEILYPAYGGLMQLVRLKLLIYMRHVKHPISISFGSFWCYKLPLQSNAQKFGMEYYYLLSTTQVQGQLHIWHSLTMFRLVRAAQPGHCTLPARVSAHSLSNILFPYPSEASGVTSCPCSHALLSLDTVLFLRASARALRNFHHWFYSTIFIFKTNRIRSS